MPSLQEGDSQLRLVPQLWLHALQSCPAKRIAQRSFGRGGVCAWLRQRLVLAGLLMSPCRNTPWSSFWWVVQHCTHKLKKSFIVNIAESGLRLAGHRCLHNGVCGSALCLKRLGGLKSWQLVGISSS